MQLFNKLLLSVATMAAAHLAQAQTLVTPEARVGNPDVQNCWGTMNKEATLANMADFALAYHNETAQQDTYLNNVGDEVDAKIRYNTPRAPKVLKSAVQAVYIKDSLEVEVAITGTAFVETDFGKRDFTTVHTYTFHMSNPFMTDLANSQTQKDAAVQANMEQADVEKALSQYGSKKFQAASCADVEVVQMDSHYRPQVTQALGVVQDKDVVTMSKLTDLVVQ